MEENTQETNKVNKKTKKEWYNDKEFIVKLALIIGIVTLAALDKDGWGWLIFLYLVAFH
mgnify:CR=1 FL=1